MTVTSSRPSGLGGPGPGALDADALAAAHYDPERIIRGAGRLRAITVEVSEEVIPDLVRAGGGPGRTLWRSSDLVLLGAGQALHLPLPGGWAAPEHTRLVSEVLRAIPGAAGDSRDSEPGLGPVAMGALPYDPAFGGHLTVPRLLVGRPMGTSRAPWVTLVVPEDAIRSTLGAGSDPRAAIEDEVRGLADDTGVQHLPDGFELAASMPHDEWKQLVRRAVAEMEKGSFDKVVLARRIDVVANRPFVLHDTLARLASLYPSCAVFHVEGFIGASPETLVRRTGREIVSHPLAGTVARSGDDRTDAALLAGLMASAKDRREHQLVVDAIAAQLRPLCSSLDVPAEPAVMALRNVSHLGTLLRGTLATSSASSGNNDKPALATALELAALLQPTPAVGGHPTDAAVRWQRDNEGFERGCYAGPVGWVDARGDGEWALGLRSAHVSGCKATMYAGNGIVLGSDPDAELAETQLKLQALLAALVRP